MVIPNWKVHSHALLTRLPLSIKASFYLPFDLHVLSMPPAFVLSQDQTLMFNPQYIWCKPYIQINSQSLTFCCCTCLATYKQLCVKRSAACKPFHIYFSKIIKTSTCCYPPLSLPSRCFRCRLVLIVITTNRINVNTFFASKMLFLQFLAFLSK